MNKITTQFALASLLYASIWYAPLAYSAATTRTIQKAISKTALLIEMTPEMQARGLTQQNLAPFANLIFKTQTLLSEDERRQLINLIAENVIVSNQLAKKKEQCAASLGQLAAIKVSKEHLFKQIKQLHQESETTQKELATTQQQEQTARHELLAAREREQTLAEELTTVKTALAFAKQELDDIRKHPQILLPLYHFSEDAQPTDPTDLTI